MSSTSFVWLTCQTATRFDTNCRSCSQFTNHSLGQTVSFIRSSKAPRLGWTRAKAQQSRLENLTMMPIGVPKVAYRVPGAPQADWVDIYNRLYRERIIFLGQEIDDEISNQIIAVMLYLDSEDNTKPIYLYINSPGGSVIAGLAIYDTMKHIASEVVTVNVGLAASMSSFLLAAGEKGKRLALPHSRVMIHQPMGGAKGQASDIQVEARQILRIKESLVRDYCNMTGQPYEKMLKDLDRDNFMSAYEAIEYGLIDRVIETKAT
ncbi:ATP-dependent Clp protease proteolytic subunit 2 [Galdieria sulphuraria]|uniref:ATP-dependent Clp protease proteolytic subunit n=1 Tax=Galdieria sulphuraria TaxID=130081 RepID=M2Y0T6_GALSU|nr:ATP-dependent Clp protease, protease subunit [Galdieria sulphuraria]EME29429.1 ATP-dependent Clp protease, protease subunit [Galdieria sulphuraria]GJD08901.1 ATP-dependent Clp protease proteolytic subunit 2 [Galdieria sulphuraria]|eukprot:XP_005705949.1 ATP-dependent Clp protease, protease subunit [Galdieria sulphuraria]